MWQFWDSIEDLYHNFQRIIDFTCVANCNVENKYVNDHDHRQNRSIQKLFKINWIPLVTIYRTPDGCVLPQSESPTLDSHDPSYTGFPWALGQLDFSIDFTGNNESAFQLNGNASNSPAKRWIATVGRASRGQTPRSSRTRRQGCRISSKGECLTKLCNSLVYQRELLIKCNAR